MTELKPHIRLRGAALALATAAFVAPVLAADLTRDEVQSAVETWVRHVTAEARADAVVVDMEPYLVDGEVVAYIAHLSEGGFCLCSADDRLAPVYLYSPGGKYDQDHPDQRYILDEIAARLTAWRAAEERRDPALRLYEKELTHRAAYWQALVAGDPPPDKGGDRGRGDPDMMVLPLTCHWHQRSPYNDQCPNLTPGEDERVKVGCVATAMAQVMYYWKWSQTGEGSGSTEYGYQWRDYWDGEPLADDPNIPAWWNSRLMWTPYEGGTLWMNGYWDVSVFVKARDDITEDPAFEAALRELDNRGTYVSEDYEADFGASTYDWSQMADVHTDPPDAGDAQAAQLCYHAAVSVYMSFGLFASAAHAWYVPTALVDHFRYDPDAIHTALDTEAMTAEIQWLRPVIFNAVDPSAFVGHAWVVYGYNKATDPLRQFLMNFGWGGDGDGWYSCDQIDPPGWLFSDDQSHVKRIAPESVVRFVGSSAPGDGTPGSPYRDIEEAVQEAPDNVTLIFKAGSVNTFAGGLLTIDRPMTLKGYDITIQPE